MLGPAQFDHDVLRELFEQAPLPYQSLDENQRIRLVNAAWLTLLQRNRDEVIGRPFEDFMAERNRPGMADRFARFVASGAVAGAEFDLVRKDGLLVTVKLDGTVVTDGQGRFLRTHCILLDITAAREAARRLADSERRHRTLVETAQEGIWQVDPAGVTNFVNPAMARMLGYEPVEMEGRVVFDFVAPAFQDVARRRLRRVARGESGLQEVKLRHRDGSEVQVILATAPYLDDSGRFCGGVAGVMDVTHLRRLEQHMLNARKLESLGVMAGGIAHDFNNLLQTIQGNAELLQAGAAAGSDEAHSLDAIHRACRQAAGLCGQMLACAGKEEVALETVQPAELMNSARDLLRAAVARKVGLELVVDEDLPPLRADPVRMRQLLVNLVANASEAIGDDAGIVTVAASRRHLDAAGLARLFPAEKLEPGGYLVLAVSDDGCGMEPEVLNSIFDPFFTTKFTGRGLGLAVVRGVARNHGGAVLVASRPGAGTTVEVFLPASPAAGDSPANPPRSAVATTGTVLIADDEPAVLAVGERMCERLGWRTRTAGDGAAALAALAAAPGAFDAVILDWSMPVMDGREALARIRAAAPGLPVIIASGHAAALAAEEGIAPDAFLDKPYALAQLRAVLAPYGRRKGPPA